VVQPQVRVLDLLDGRGAAAGQHGLDGALVLLGQGGRVTAELARARGQPTPLEQRGPASPSPTRLSRRRG